MDSEKLFNIVTQVFGLIGSTYLLWAVKDQENKDLEHAETNGETNKVRSIIKRHTLLTLGTGALLASYGLQLLSIFSFSADHCMYWKIISEISILTFGFSWIYYFFKKRRYFANPPQTNYTDDDFQKIVLDQLAELKREISATRIQVEENTRYIQAMISKDTPNVTASKEDMNNLNDKCELLNSRLLRQKVKLKKLKSVK